MAQRLKRLRKEKELSAQALAERAGIPVTTYREWENGRQILGEPYEKLAQALNVSLYEILTGKTPKLADAFTKIEEIESQLKSLRSHLGSL
ncbi:helix-turn-helix domain-containing protein [Bdellovibrio sp. HCB209]|uniref:helix-turn-helix domain-containing protein n=1 Tax=Bdellovibrio sp. HCB209 TaxID=3394354 RepID=UPI0039B5149E